MKNAEKGYRLNVPYPVPCRPLHPPGRGTLAHLRTRSAGRAGELTACCRHVQAGARCRAQGEGELADLFDAAAEATLARLRLLSAVLVCCGGDPAPFTPANGHKLWWSGAWAMTERDPAALLRQALTTELSACTAYRALLHELPDELLPCAERLLADAQHFADLFRSAALRRGTGRQWIVDS